MSRSWGKSTGPCLWVSSRKHPPSRDDLGGSRVAMRAGIDHQTGFLINVAVADLFSVLALWYPNHQKAGCLTMMRVHRIGEDLPVVHRCFVSFFPEKMWGPDPSEIDRARRTS